MNNTELYHHGVKGQRWGVRRYQNKDGSLTSYGKKRYAKELAKLEAEKKRIRQQEQTAKKMKKLDDMRKDIDERKKALKTDDETPEPTKQQKAPSAPKKRKLSELSNEEIQEKIDRMNLENKYKELAQERIDAVSKKEVSKGRKFAEEVIEKAGKNIATQTTAWAMGTATNKVIEYLTGEKDAIDPKNVQKIKK